MQNNITGDFPPQSTIPEDSNRITGSSPEFATPTNSFTHNNNAGSGWQSVGNILGIIGGIIAIIVVLVAYFWGLSSKLGDVEKNTNTIIEKVEDSKQETKEMKTKVEANSSSINDIKHDIKDIKTDVNDIKSKIKK